MAQANSSWRSCFTVDPAWLKPGVGPFCVELACSNRTFVGFRKAFRFPSKNMLHGLIEDSKMSLRFECVACGGATNWFRVDHAFTQQKLGWFQQPCDPRKDSAGS